MASFYENKRVMKLELSKLFIDHKGEKIKIAPLVNNYGSRFGFGKRTLINTLQEYADDNVIFLYKDEFEVPKE